jgi:SAM-dependent methyltransferase
MQDTMENTTPPSETGVLHELRQIQDWRHPYVIDGKPTSLEKEWWREWHPWRWQVDVPVISSAVGSCKGKTLLDVACNDGWYSFEASKRGFDVTGVDIREEATRRGQLLQKHFNCQNIKFLTGDVEDPATISQAYDVVLFYGILYHLADPIGVLKRVGSLTRRIIAVQSFCHSLDNRPALYLFREDPELAGNAMTRLVTTPTQRAMVIMLKEAGFDHIYRALPQPYLASRFNSSAEWQWSFIYGVKGAPLTPMPGVYEVNETDAPLNSFGLASRLKGRMVSGIKRRLGKDIDDPNMRKNSGK